MKYVELLLYCEKEKLTIVENQKQWIHDQMQEQLQTLYYHKKHPQLSKKYFILD